jgi:RNA-directed DNA polymerase
MSANTTGQTEMVAGAASHVEANWHSIDWQNAHKNVRRLQARIVKATQEGKWGKVKALQRLLTHSFSGKALAVKRVTENKGKWTPGVDKQIWETPAKKMAAVYSLRQHGYKPLPLRRVYIPKSSNPKKKRPLSIPTMKDRAMQALYLLALEPIAETTADPNSYGFRTERSAADAIRQCFIALSRRFNAQWVLEGDIKSCFDRISHAWLLANIPMEKAILNKWLNAGFMEKHILYPTEEGTPQGGIASPILANLTLDGLEKMFKAKYPKGTTWGDAARVNLIRYADDFVITGSSKELLENEIRPLVEQFLAERGLELSAEKTRITHIEDGFDFLGQNIRKYNGKLLIKPAKKNVKRLLTKVRKIIKDHKQVTAGELITLLNPVIRGWAYYHRHVQSSETFHSVDHAIFQAIWKWAIRRHQKRSRKWVKNKYFKTIGRNHWVFFGECYGKEQHLFKASSLSIQPHNKIRGDANPFDPAWEPYFENRLGLKMVGTLHGRRQLIRLWKEQNGICPVCRQKITKLTGWHNHHIMWRSLGGPDTADNRVLLHPNCHAKVHSQNVSVEKPCPSLRGK